MSEIAIDISRQRSKGLEAFAGQRFDFVITVCARAAETCPRWPGVEYCASRNLARATPSRGSTNRCRTGGLPHLPHLLDNWRAAGGNEARILTAVEEQVTADRLSLLEHRPAATESLVALVHTYHAVEAPPGAMIFATPFSTMVTP